MSKSYDTVQPERGAVAAWPGVVALEFGVDWCGYCQAAKPVIESALAGRAQVRHMKVEDGSGRPLGRAFRVKLWPTVVVLKDGEEVARVVRPGTADEVRAALREAGAT
ncbi:MAG: thioredoxin family protein [Pseudomonadota bacterium]